MGDNKNESSQNKDDKNKIQANSFTDNFKQQVMKAWQPVPTIKSTIVLFALLTIFFLVFGIILISYSDQVKEFSVQYEDQCDIVTQNQINQAIVDGNIEDFTCQVNIEIEEEMEGPVFVYYELTNFYQNHRRYVISRNIDQLQGEDVSRDDLKADCEPILTNKEAGKIVSYTGVPLDPNAVAIPCGLIANSLFSDNFDLRPSQSNFGDDYLSISDNNIAWPSDKKHKFKNRQGSEEVAWANLEDNERLIVWMRTAALPSFRKIWGRIEQNIQPGKYTIDILNTFDVEKFKGTKTFVLSTANAFGGKNQFLAIAYLVVGSICFIVTISFIVKQVMHRKQKSN